MQNAASANTLGLQAQQDTARQQATVDSQREAGIGHYNDILAHPGYSDAEKQGIASASMAPVGAAYDSLQQSAGSHVAKTGNSAGYAELLGQLARAKGSQVADIANNNQLKFADRAATDRNTALSGLSGLYGTDASLLATKLGIPLEALNASNQALGGAATSAEPWWKSVLGAGAQVASAAIPGLQRKG